MIKERDKNVIKFIEKYNLLTIEQAAALFFPSYETARRRLYQLCNDFEKIKCWTVKETGKKCYYLTRKSSYHDILAIDFLAILKKNGCNILDVKRQPRYYVNDKNYIVPDLFVIFSYCDNVYFVLLEVDLNHFTDYPKFKKYEELYKTGKLQMENYGQFPILVIAKESQNIRYNSSNFPVIYTDLGYNNISDLLL